MATKINYNGVEILDVLTDSIDQQVEYDRTGVDPIAVRVRVTCTGTIHTLTGYSMGVSRGDRLATSIAAVSQRLLVPRRRFRMEVGGVTLFDVLPAAAEDAAVPVAATMNRMDVEHGPRPQARVVQIVGQHSARVQFSIEFVVPNCQSATAGVLNLRFWIADDIATDWTTTRTYHGRLRLAHAKLNPHAFRNLVLPPLQPGFQRQSMRFVGSENGLELEFTIVDQELYAQAPYPASDWDCRLTVSTPFAGGSIGETEMSLTLVGAKDAKRTELLALAARILNQKLHFLDAEKDGRTLLLSAAITEEYKNNRVHATARVRNVGDYAIMNLVTRDLGRPIALEGYHTDIATPARPTATTVGLFLAALQSSCSPATVPQALASVPAPPKTTKGKGPEVRIEEGTLTPYENKFSRNHQQNLYNYYHLTSDYDVDEGVVRLPLGKEDSNGDTSLEVRLYQPQATRVIRVRSERLGKWPELPAPKSFTDKNGITHTLVRRRVTPHGVQLAADGRKALYTVDYDLHYQLSRVPKDSESWPVGKVPLRKAVDGEEKARNLPPEVFQDPESADAIN